MNHYVIDSVSNCLKHKKQIYDLFFLCFSESYTAFEYYWANVCYDQSYLMFDGNKLVAMCLNTTKSFMRKSETIVALSISGVSVHPEYRGKKLSKQLLQHVLAHNQYQFDLILLQANNYKIYEWMKFTDNEHKFVVKLSHPFQYRDETFPHNLHSFINYEQLYQIFVVHQKTHTSQLLWSYEEFCNYVKYKLANNEHLYYTERAFLFYNQDDPITAFGYYHLQDLCNLTYLIQANELTFYCNQQEWKWLEQRHYHPELLRTETALQINKPKYLDWAIYLWDFFV